VQSVGSAVTFPNIPTWYANLNQPPWTPPNWLFGPVWTTLYIMLAIFGWRLWHSFSNDRFKQPVIQFYFLQLFFNFLWSPLFFWYHWTAIAFVDLLLIILFTVLTFIQTRKIFPALAWWLIPYLLWLCYAASLNGAIAYLN